jgi:nucleotide-binding universal stress UspA family protein
MRVGMTPNTNVVVAFDLSQSSRAALDRGIALAKRAPGHILHFVCAIEPHRPLVAVPTDGKLDYEYAARVQERLREEIAAALRASTGEGVVHFYVHARFGKAAEEILQVAREVGAEMIVIATKGLTGVERLVMGSVAEHVVREAECSVIVARPTSYPYVELLDVKEKEPHLTYLPPHRYSYDNHQVALRPMDWPLY